MLDSFQAILFVIKAESYTNKFLKETKLKLWT